MSDSKKGWLNIHHNLGTYFGESIDQDGSMT